MPTKEQLEYARVLWDCATGAGTDGATTSFSHLYDKDKPNQRPYALGYMQRTRCMKLLKTPEGKGITGVDCSRPTSSPEREQRVRRVLEEFFGQCVRMSKAHQVKKDDYKRVGEARGLQENDYVLFSGFFNVLISPALKEAVQRWKQEEALEAEAVRARTAPALAPAPPPPAPAPPPPAPERKRVSHICEMDESDDEAPPAPPQSPPSPQPPQPPTYTPSSPMYSPTAPAPLKREKKKVVAPAPAPAPTPPPERAARFVAPQHLEAHQVSYSPRARSGGTPPPFMDPPRPRPVSKPARGFQQPREESEGMRNMVAFAASPDCPVKTATSGTYIGLARRDEPNGWAFANDRERNSNDNSKWRAARSFYERAQAWARQQRRTDASSNSSSDPAPPPKAVVDLTDDDDAPAPMPTVLAGDALPEWSARPAQPPVEDVRFAKLHVNLGPLGIGREEPDPNEKLPLVDRVIRDIPPSATPPPKKQRQTTLDGAPPRDYVVPDHSAGEQWPGPQRPTRQQTLDAFVAPPAPAPDEEEWELTRAAPGEVFDTDRPHSPPRPAAPAPAAPAPAPPAPAAKPPKKRKRDPDADAAGGVDDDWRVAGMGRSVLRDFATAKARAIAGKLSFNANSVAVFWKRGDYTTMVKQRTRGGSAGQTDAYTVLSPTLKRLTGKAQLRSELEIQRFFNARPELRDADSVEGE